MYFQKRTYSLFLVATLLFASACATQKKRGEKKGLAKLYDNTTAKYNGYFNADVIVDETLLSLKESHRDNYAKLLPIYEYMAIEDSKAIASELDRAIEKSAIVINLHRESDWEDDCYLIIGKSQFLKQEYEEAVNTFRYMMDEFDPIKLETRTMGTRISLKDLA